LNARRRSYRLITCQYP